MENAPCQPNPGCKYYPNCYTDTHHLLYPSNSYVTPLERLYRSLEENTVELCRSEHDAVHATQEPPAKPTREAMIQALGSSMVYISVTKRKQIYGE